MPVATPTAIAKIVAYPFGYAGGFKTLAELEKQSSWMLEAPEFRRRIVALMDQAQREGVALGVGGAGRTKAQQLNLFYDRHHECIPPCDNRYNGVCYCLNDGAAAAAPPGLSWHEQSTPEGWAAAVDMVGDLTWMDKHCATYGLVNARTWSTHEPWHVQPVEFPQSRRNYDPAIHKLTVFPLPGTPTPVPPTPPPANPAPIPPDVRIGVKKGDSGLDVYLAQTVMRHGAGQVLIVPDGSFGSKTEAGVKNIQTMFGLTVTGVIDQVTWQALAAVAAKPPIAVNV